jgi:hypothetical protein
MRKDKTLTLLRYLPQKKLNLFLDFVASPYFNKNQQLLDFANYLATFHPLFPEESLSLETIPSYILAPDKRNKKGLSYLKSNLNKLLKAFIGQQHYQENTNVQELDVLQGLRNIGSDDYVPLLSAYKHKLDQLPKLGNEELWLQYTVANILRGELSGKPADVEVILQESINKLDEYYLINKLSYGIEIQNRQQVIQFAPSFQNDLMDPIEHLLRDKKEMGPRLSLYYQLFLCFKYTDIEEHFYKLVQLLQQHQLKIEPTECRGIYLATINRCVRQMRVDYNTYATICLGLYEEGIRTKILFERGLLTEWTYRNVIKIGLRSERYKWTENFIHTYNPFLIADAQKNALYSNLAEVAFSQKDYDQTFEHLHKIKINHFRYQLSTKILLIKTFYETGNIDSCLSALGAFTVYLSRLKGVSSAVKKNCQHFCQLLYQILMQGSDKKKEKTKLKIQQQTPLAEREWLMDVFSREHPRI